MTYLTGMHFHLSERPIVFIFPVDGLPSIVLPELEAQKAAHAPFDLRVFTYGESPDTWGPAYASGCEAVGIGSDSIGVEPGALRVLELRLLEAACPQGTFIRGDLAVAELRMQKDADELASMRRATHIAEEALSRTLPDVKEGVTERTISGKLIGNMLEMGSGGELPFQPIIAFGANSANPHAVPSDYALQRGDLVLFDWGANYDGYFSDLTRMFSFGEPDPELRSVVQIVCNANTAARSAASPGIPASSLDIRARSVIEEAGYGPYFVHRTGHGLGLEVHEPPYIRGDNDQILLPGMTFTIEPGIYLNGRGGARIEDDMVITSEGAESLSTFPRELTVLGQ
jgi:Xaa-Pro dipeptidase